MCPDRQMLSLYCDQELPSPWKEKLEAHLVSCGSCREALEKYQSLSAGLISGFSPGSLSDAGDSPEERVWQRLSLEIEAPGKQPFIRRPSIKQPSIKQPPLWQRSIPVPLPVAAAAAAILVLAFAATFMQRPGTVNQVSDSALAFGADGETAAEFSDMNGVLRYLGEDDASEVIRLPESRNFSSSGAPRLIKASDYSGSIPAK
ncbi:hypothetical protein FACS1894151_00420 [Spirochaetia bacterium]|nr:hypothetical protein FACS1894151_00420 [Spirochaetia bacterium]